MKFRIRMPSRTPPQRRYDESTKRFNLSLWGRQSGKTTSGYRKLIWKPLKDIATRPANHWATYWHVLQTYSAADIVFERYLRMLHPFRDQVLRYKNESERRVELIGKINVFFKSGQNFEDLRTESLDGAVIDEARQQRKELWNMVIFPMLSKTKGWADILSSPNGFDWLYDLKKEKEQDPNWGIQHAPSWEAWWWTPEEINEAKKNMNELEFRQEIGAEFVNLRTGKVYYAFSEDNKRTDCPFAPGKIWSPYHSVILGADFNVNPMCWNLQQLGFGMWWFFGEIHMPDSNTYTASDELVQRILLMKSMGFRPSDVDVTICGDASGKASSTKSNQSDYDIIKGKLKEAGITYKDITPEANPSIKDRVNAVNTACKSAAGQSNLFVHPHECKYLVNDFERVVWKQGADFILDPGKNRQLTHASDGAGYPIAKLTPVKLVRAKPKNSIIARGF